MVRFEANWAFLNRFPPLVTSELWKFSPPTPHFQVHFLLTFQSTTPACPLLSDTLLKPPPHVSVHSWNFFTFRFTLKGWNQLSSRHLQLAIDFLIHPQRLHSPYFSVHFYTCELCRLPDIWGGSNTWGWFLDVKQ